MKLGRVTGTVWATRKDEGLTGLKLLVVEDLDLAAKSKASFVVAADSVGAGVHDVVLYATGSSARQTEETQGKAVDAVIMAVVDSVEIKGDNVYNKATDG